MKREVKPTGFPTSANILVVLIEIINGNINESTIGGIGSYACPRNGKYGWFYCHKTYPEIRGCKVEILGADRWSKNLGIMTTEGY